MDSDLLLLKYQAQLKRFIAVRVHSPQDAEDILQEVLIKAYLHLHNVEEDKIRAWLFQITRNSIIDYYRKSHQIAKANRPLDRIEDLVSDFERNERNEHSLVSSWLEILLNRLPEMDRQALEKVDLGGVSQKELANQLGISFSGMKSRVQRARQKLKHALLDCCTVNVDRLGKVIDYQVKEKDCFCEL